MMSHRVNLIGAMTLRQLSCIYDLAATLLRPKGQYS